MIPPRLVSIAVLLLLFSNILLINAEVASDRIAVLLVWENVAHGTASAAATQGTGGGSNSQSTSPNGISRDDQYNAVSTITDYLYNELQVEAEIELFAASVGKTPHGGMKTVASIRLGPIATANGASIVNKSSSESGSGRGLLGIEQKKQQQNTVDSEAILKLLQASATESNLKAQIGEVITRRKRSEGIVQRAAQTARRILGFEGRVDLPRLVRILTTPETLFGATDGRIIINKNANRFATTGADKAIGTIGSNKRFTPRYFTRGQDAYQKIASASNALWDLDRINQLSRALDNNIALPAIYDQPPSEPPRVYLVDTLPLASHQEFEGRLTIIHNGHADTDGDSACDAHGTFVAAKIMGKTVGLNPYAQLFAASALNCEGWGYTSDIYLALIAVHEHCVAEGGREQRSIAINLSLGGPGDPNSPSSSALAMILHDLYVDCDATIVAAAGNSAIDARGFVPAGFSGPDQGNVVTVGASNIADEFASFSNYGPKIDISAPGVNILSAGITSNDLYEQMSGTSASAPIITGILSLYHTSRPSNFDLMYPGYQYADNAINKLKADANRAITKVPTATTSVRLAYLSPSPIPANELLSPVAPASTPPGWVQTSDSSERVWEISWLIWAIVFITMHSIALISHSAGQL